MPKKKIHVKTPWLIKRRVRAWEWHWGVAGENWVCARVAAKHFDIPAGRVRFHFSTYALPQAIRGNVSSLCGFLMIEGEQMPRALWLELSELFYRSGLGGKTIYIAAEVP